MLMKSISHCNLKIYLTVFFENELKEVCFQLHVYNYLFNMSHGSGTFNFESRKGGCGGIHVILNCTIS